MVSTIEAPKTLDDLVTYEDISFEPESGISAGTIGTRGWQGSITVSKVPKSLVITYIGDSSMVQPLVFWFQNKIYCNMYRCTSSTVSSSGAKTIVRAFY